GSLVKNGLLKTTTWGSLIGLSLLAAAFGFRGTLSSSHGDSTEQTEARLESPQLSLAQRPTDSALQSADSGQQLRLNQPTLDRRRTSTVSAVSRQATPTTSSTFSGMAAKSGGPSQSPGDATSSDNQDPQRLIAAKIAPDLKGIDPEKPVDVNVQ